MKKIPFDSRISMRVETDPKLLNAPAPDTSITKTGPGQYKRGKYTREQLRFMALDMFKKGMWESEIRDTLKRLIGPDYYKDEFNLTKTVSDICTDARDVITNAYTTKTAEMLWIHSERYQKQINKFKNVDFLKLDPEQKDSIVASTVINQLRAMKAKEKLLGMHKKEMKIKFLTKTETKAYDLSLLTNEEQVELYHLIQKTKKRELLTEFKSMARSVETVEFEEIKEQQKYNPLQFINNIVVEEVPKEEKKLTLEDLKKMFKNG